MSGKPKITIVMGDVPQPRILLLLAGLKARFEVVVIAFNHPKLSGDAGADLHLRLFEPITDMPGYIRGLENELASSDVIVGFETSRLVAFQSVRTAVRDQKPFISLVSDAAPFSFDLYPNIRAIQHDILENADRFWALSEAAARTLVNDGVDPARISLISPRADSAKFSWDEAARRRFRDYIKVSAAEKVILCVGPLEPGYAHEDLLRAFASLCSRGRAPLKDVRLLFVGNGTLARDLKYLSVDLGLGQRVMFLHQDIEPFARDLYCACDVMFVPRCRNLDVHEEYPLFVLEAMASGVVPVLAGGTVAAELAGKAAHLIANESSEAIARTIGDILGSEDILKQARFSSVDQIAAYNARSGDYLCDEIDSLRRAVCERSAVKGDSSQVIADLDAAVKGGAEQSALVTIEDLLLRHGSDKKLTAELLRVKGDVLYVQRRFDQAMEVYGACVQSDETNAKAYRGLGYIAWSGHSNDEALTFFRRALSLNESDPRTMLGIGLVFRRIGVYEDALYWLERCVGEETVQNTAMTALTQTCIECPRPEKALPVLRRVIESMGELPQLMLTLGRLYINSGQMQVGNEILQRAMGKVS